MELLSQLLSTTNLVLCLAVVALVWVQRKGFELLIKKAFKKDLSKYDIWTEFLVPLAPLGTGALLTLIPQLPVMAMFAEGLLNRMVFGLGLGLVSGLVFRLIKKNVVEKVGDRVKDALYSD